MPISDEQLLKLVQNECRQSIGFDTLSSELTVQRQIALEYIKGEMRDVPSLRGRSSQVSYDVANVIEAVLPDILEIFEGDEVCNFVPNNPNDIDQARQETQYVSWVVMKQNNGYELFYNAFKDAFSQKIGVWVYDWVPGQPKVERFENKTSDEVKYALINFGPMAQNRTPLTPTIGELTQDPENGLFGYTITTPKHGRVEIKNWRPEDVAVSDDTMVLGEGTFCAFRTRVRRHELLADGFDPKIVEDIPVYNGEINNTIIDQARDTVGEYASSFGIVETNPALDLVEITYNYLRYPGDDGDVVIYRVATAGYENEILLKTEVVNRVQAASITPFPVPHKFHGLSLADKTIPTQKLKTSLLRMALDSFYYALNNRVLVPESSITKNTISDLLNNVPGGVIRHDGAPGSITTLTQAGQLPVDPLQLLEFASVASEQDTGVARASMGLTPDTLHDTSSGMLKLLSNAQRRVRTMARNFAEGGVKHLYLGVHDLIRENESLPSIFQVDGEWIPVDPTTWLERRDMSCEIAGAHGGRDYDMQVYGVAQNIMTQLVQAQTESRVDGPLVQGQGMLNLVSDMLKRAGVKSPARYFPPQYQAPPPQPPPPDPQMVKVQADAQLGAQKLQLDQQKAQMDAANTKARNDAEAANRRLEITLRAQGENVRAQLDEKRMDMDAAIKAHDITKQAEIKQQQMILDAHLQSVEQQLADAAEKARLEAEAQRTAVDQQHNLIDMARGHALEIAQHNLATQQAQKPDSDPAE